MADGRPGRPSLYTEEIAEALVEWISQGKTLRSFCRQPGMPSRSTIDSWRRDRPDFSGRVARARDDGFEELAEQCIEIADDGANDTYTDEEGRQRTDHDVLGRSRLRVDTRLKLLACWDPRRYGNKAAPVDPAVEPDARFE